MMASLCNVLPKGCRYLVYHGLLSFDISAKVSMALPNVAWILSTSRNFLKIKDDQILPK